MSKLVKVDKIANQKMTAKKDDQEKAKRKANLFDKMETRLLLSEFGYDYFMNFDYKDYKNELLVKAQRMFPQFTVDVIQKRLIYLKNTYKQKKASNNRKWEFYDDIEDIYNGIDEAIGGNDENSVDEIETSIDDENDQQKEIVPTKRVEKPLLMPDLKKVNDNPMDSPNKRKADQAVQGPSKVARIEGPDVKKSKPVPAEQRVTIVPALVPAQGNPEMIKLLKEIVENQKKIYEINVAQLNVQKKTSEKILEKMEYKQEEQHSI